EWRSFEQRANGHYRALLLSLHGALLKDNLHFGYRVAREIARFVELAAEQTAGTPAALLAAFDVAIHAKVLPKLHGTQAELEEVLARLFSWSVDLAPDPDGTRHLEGWFMEAANLV